MQSRGTARSASDEIRWPQSTAGRYPSLPFILLSGLLLVTSASAALFSLIPTDQLDLHTLSVAGALFFLTGSVWVWFMAPRIPNGWGLDTAIVMSAVVTTIAVAAVTQPEVQVMLGLSILLFGVYAAYFRPMRRFIGELAIMLTVYGVMVIWFAPELHPLYFLVIGSLTTAVCGTVAVLVKQLREQAVIDGLTGTLNRRGLHSVGAYLQAEARRSGRPLTVGLVDIDDFKAYNDRNGHIAGDALLVSVGRSLTEGLRASDVVARFGGDEFAVLLPGADTREAVGVLARVAEQEPVASWSIGLSEWGADESLENALARADADLYRMKRRRTGSS
ncbi:MAG: GGDEF domain-containing protein [Candidatus Nanopelagicales bacterium]